MPGTIRAILALSCPNQRGIVAAVASYLAESGCNIVESQQFDDALSGRFFMRIVFDSELGRTADDLRQGFEKIRERYDMRATLADASVRRRVLLMVSRFGHCLNDLLYRRSIDALPIEIPAVVSNHIDLKPLVDAAGIRFIHIPVTAATKQTSEEKLRTVIADLRCETVVLARYMQVLSDRFCQDMPGEIINIHHSYLPSFKGAKPYHQAHARGVKLIGATAHYVTADLDEGPIIEQGVARVSHLMSPTDLIAVGRDIEASVLARAVRWHAEHRIIPNGHTTVVFDQS
ncbi:formyltetrahydrofolate deformylase [Sphingomonas panacis]|uniref:Formyltetrahydrofolate deformylase n=1 Tax=Sphingomonas panacis TaxID=1560345 RepID=A0A1B3Z613_9SPHN|nr:formyltetrahydrofolate deformylase [Sphingomonas panacis]AOH82859.1 formyltetrahydrofolate deformylase [Sphingomonas panacis]